MSPEEEIKQHLSWCKAHIHTLRLIGDIARDKQLPELMQWVIENNNMMIRHLEKLNETLS